MAASAFFFACRKSRRESPPLSRAISMASYYKLEVRQYERVDGIEGEDGAFVVSSTRRTGESCVYRARKVILATGFYDIPVKLGCPGEDLDKVKHYYYDPHPFYDCDVAVVGGKNSAAIYALECYRAGARVTLIHRNKELSEKIKYWILPDINNRIKRGLPRAIWSPKADHLPRSDG